MADHNLTFADVVHQSITFNKTIPEQHLIADLIDTTWMQRLRDIAQTGNTRLVYMFSEHSRFGHSLGVAYLACVVMDKLAQEFPDVVKPYREAVAAAALLHDVGHLAPGSHTAFKTWFPDAPDNHEELATKIITQDTDVQRVLASRSKELPKLVAAIMDESEEVPAWTWQIVSGGGWNVDRGNWAIVDSTMSGVSYGRYNIPALIDSLTISKTGELVLRENRLDAMMHFVVSRHAMYRQIYQHRVLLAADVLNTAIVRRLKDIKGAGAFMDDTMANVVASHDANALSLQEIFQMRESWWTYHLSRWATASDEILRDLSKRLLNRKLFKTIRLHGLKDVEALRTRATDAVSGAGFDPRYYLHEIKTTDMHAGDSRNSISVLNDDGSISKLADSDPLFAVMIKESKLSQRSWLVLPAEAKKALGLKR
jgi:HD superfamily phosphohydrolase